MRTRPGHVGDGTATLPVVLFGSRPRPRAANYKNAAGPWPRPGPVVEAADPPGRPAAALLCSSACKIKTVFCAQSLFGPRSIWLASAIKNARFFWNLDVNVQHRYRKRGLGALMGGMLSALYAILVCSRQEVMLAVCKLNMECYVSSYNPSYIAQALKRLMIQPAMKRDADDMLRKILERMR